MDASFVSFVAISAVVIVTPGPDTALTIRNIFIGGRAGGLFTALGVATGQALWASAASAGVVSILVASERVFNVIKLAGALYLIYLGARSLLSAIRGRAARVSIDDAHRRSMPRLSASAAFRQGLISNLANPKMAVFFASILPQFVPHGDQVFASLMMLGMVFCSMTFAWLALYAVALSRIQATLIRPRIQRFFEAITGAALVALGARLAFSER